MIVAHDLDCDRMDHCCGDDCRCLRKKCTCTAQADLAELVAAAGLLLKNRYSYDGFRTLQVFPDDCGRLDAALKPFREEQPK